jgi:uracil-DNA glycosylase family 4
MAPTELLLGAYLEAQSELGCDEVILPYPWVRKSGSAGSESMPPPSGFESGSSPATDPALAKAAPVKDRGTGSEGFQDKGPMASSPEGLLASLERALSEPHSSVTREASTHSRTESVALPAFPDLDAYWFHLEAHPGVAAGDPAAAGVRVVRGHGPAGAPLALAGLEPGEADAAAGLAFQGEAGDLLAKMLKAIHLDAAACYRTNLVKASRAGRATRRDLARLLPWLHAELGLVRAPFVLLLGEACAQAVLKTGKPLEELRQEPFRMEGREFVVTYHPSDLLAREELKRKAWEDLQWLRKRMAEGL